MTTDHHLEEMNMRRKYGDGDTYISPPGQTAALPTLKFMFATLNGPLRWLWSKARANLCDDIVWNNSSAWLADIFEEAGGRFVMEGLDNLHRQQKAAVFIANHMSTLEAFVLPGIIRPHLPVTFVVKKSLTTMPVFGPIMRSRDPVAVERANPREDLAVVLEEGVKRLQAGISVIVFPQHTRSLDFDREMFNSIGIKLARKAGAPVMPIALKTDAWGHGRKVKELGRIRPDLPAHFKFAPAMRVEGTGKAQHAAICDFIEENVVQWQKSEGVNR